MILWFVVLAPVFVAEVFRSPMVDYRMVMLGAVVPLLDAATGGAWFLHTLLGSVAALSLVMATTVGRRLRRRRLLGVPIGMFVHLVLDGVWAETAVFWWPVFGLDFEVALPEVDRPPVVVIGMELVAVAVAAWAIRRYDLLDPDNRRRFLRTGNLARGAV